MPMLSVRCELCKKLIPTGLVMEREDYLSLTYTERTVICPNCDHLQTWNLDDIDRSVFAGSPE